MANRIRQISGADIGVSVTGVAGPEPSEGKNVGTVFVGLSYGGITEVKKLNLGSGRVDDRELIRYVASSNALIAAMNAANRLN